MTILATVLWVVNILLDATGHVAFKSVAVTGEETAARRWKKMLASPALWVGVVCFGLEFAVWFALLSLIPLSLAMLIGSINIVVVMLAGRFLFGERLNGLRTVAMWLIAIGVGLAGGFA